MHKNPVKTKIFNIIQIGEKTNRASRIFDYFISLNILVNIVALFMDTFASLASYHNVFISVEYVTTAIFCLEYVLRMWTSDLLYPKKGPVGSRVKYFFSFEGVIILLSILSEFVLKGFVVIRLLRVVRILHLFRLNAQYDSFNVIISVLIEKRNQIFSSLFIVLILMCASSLCMYQVEHAAQPEVFRNAFSGIWWSMSTLLTIGYGDIYPITTLGKLLSIGISFLGVGAVAIPTGIISAGFVEQYQKKADISDYRAEDIKDIVEILIDERLAGKTIAVVRLEHNLNVMLIIRGDLTILPGPDNVLLEGDIIVVRVG